MEHHWTSGNLKPRRWCQSTYMLGTRPSYIPKKDASSPELSNTISPISPTFERKGETVLLSSGFDAPFLGTCASSSA